MLISERQLKAFQDGFKLIRLIGDALHKFDPVTGKLLVVNSKNVQRAHTKFCFVPGFLISILLQVIIATYLKLSTQADVLFCIFLMLAYFGMGYAQWSIITKRYKIERVFNHMLEFERTNNLSNWKPKGVAGPFVSSLMYLTTVPFPSAILAYLGQILLLPCLPAHFGFFLLPQCSARIKALEIFKQFPISQLLYEIVVKTIMVLVGAFMAHIAFPAFVLDMNLAPLCCHCIRNYIKLYSRLLSRISINSINFYGEVAIFRQIQIITIEFNDYHQKYNSVTKLIVMGLGIVIAMFALIRLHGNLLAPQFLIFGSTVMEFFCAIVFSYGVKACVYLVCKQLMHDTQAMHSLQRHKWFRRYFKSWPILKAYLGSVNYIDQLTPLNVMDFSITQLVNLLLL
ncbi:unnamed protein product [Orchesella dallaii]|uniref:Odorant receptor n=1 Tax=Orchesella dallaii TaxID=48710 RepID=A0ABP1PIJ5_9HEXA